MNYERGNRGRSFDRREHERPVRERPVDPDEDGYRDEVYSKRVPAGKRTYFFDVKSTRSGEDFFVTITESKRLDEERYEKHKIFLYKEDFAKFLTAMNEVVQHVKKHCLPEYDFRDVPDVSLDAKERPRRSSHRNMHRR
jgi:hypothetical protein